MRIFIFLFLFCVKSYSLIAQEAWTFKPGYYTFDPVHNDTLKKMLDLQPRIDSIIKGDPKLDELKPFFLTYIATYIEFDNYDSVICKKIKIVLEDKDRDLKMYDLILKNNIALPHHMLYLNLPEHTQLHTNNSTHSDVVYSREEMDGLSNIKVKARFTDRSKNRWLEISLHSVMYIGDKYEDHDFRGWIQENELEIVPFIWN